MHIVPVDSISWGSGVRGLLSNHSRGTFTTNDSVYAQDFYTKGDVVGLVVSFRVPSEIVFRGAEHGNSDRWEGVISHTHLTRKASLKEAADIMMRQGLSRTEAKKIVSEEGFNPMVIDFTPFIAGIEYYRNGKFIKEYETIEEFLQAPFRL